MRLGVNIDHVATVRQARGEKFPDPVQVAQTAVQGGADGITAHLREDRRHIQESDLEELKKHLRVPLNMEMSIDPSIVAIAQKLVPAWTCLVPEKRKELTTEGGLDVQHESDKIGRVVKILKSRGIKVSLFVDPDFQAVKIAKELNADAVELHTGEFARLFRVKDKGVETELERIRSAAETAGRLNLLANAGHGIDYDNVSRLIQVYPFHELNIGFSIVARSLFVGFNQAVKEMKAKLG